MDHEKSVDALLHWAASTQLAMRRVMDLLGVAPFLDGDPEDDLEDARAWRAELVDAIDETRTLMATPPPGNHDPHLMRSVTAGRAGANNLLDYGDEIARLFLKIAESFEAGAEDHADVLMDLLLDYPTLVLEARAGQFADAAAALPPEDAARGLMLLNRFAYLIVLEIQHAQVAAERGRDRDLAAAANTLDVLLREYADSLSLADRLLKKLEQELPRLPEPERKRIAPIVPDYFEDLTEFSLLLDALKTLPAIARAAEAIEDFAENTDPVWRAFRRAEDANDARALRRAQRIEGDQHA